MPFEIYFVNEVAKLLGRNPIVIRVFARELKIGKQQYKGGCYFFNRKDIDKLEQIFKGGDNI